MIHHPARGVTRRRTFMLVCGALALGVGASAPARGDGAAGKAGQLTSDLQVVRQVLSIWSDAGRDTGRDAWQRSRAEARKIYDAGLRRRVLGLRGELEQAAARHAVNRRIEADVSAAGGSTKREPGGPGWLRELLGPAEMELFSRLTEVSFYQGMSAHDPKYHLNERITDDWLERLEGAADLRVLNLENTHVTGPGLRHIERLTKLESLNLTLAPVTDPYLVHLRRLTRLRVLGLASTKVTGEGCRHLRAASHLVNLNCHFTPVNDAGLAEIGKLKSLERLEIVHTHFTDAGAAHLRGLVHLARLQLGSREATGAALAELRALPELRELDIHDLQPDRQDDMHLGDLQRLTVLRVYIGSLPEAGVKSLARLPRLEELNLSEVHVTRAGLAALAQSASLRKLTLPREVDEEAIRSLRAALPALQILR